MKILRNLLYSVLFVSSLIFNHSFADENRSYSQKIEIEFTADLYPSTCNGVKITPLIDFGAFTFDDLRQGNVQTQKLSIQLICDDATGVDEVIVVIRPGLHGYLDSSTLLTSKKEIGIKLISSKYGVIISDKANPNSMHKLDSTNFEEIIEFKPVHLGGEITAGKFESFATVEIQYK